MRYKKLNEISDKIEYGLGASAVKFDGIHTYIRITDIDEDTGTLNPSKVSPSSYSDEYILNQGDILVARTGASVGKSYIHDETQKCYFAGFLMRIKILNHNSYYIYQQLKTDKFKKWLEIMSIRSGQPGINAKELGLYKVKIGNKLIEDKQSLFFKLIDNKINTQKKIIEDIQSQISQIKDNMFDNISGQVTSLEKVLIESNIMSTTINQYPIISSTVKGLFLQSEYFDREIASKNNIGYKVIEKNEIIISPQNLWMGNITYNKKYDNGLVSPSYKIFKVCNGCNSNYIFEMLTTKKAFYLYKTVSEQGASVVRRNLNMEAFMELTFKIPPLNVQNQVMKVLNLFAKKIENEKKILTLYNEQKQYFLNALFI